MLDPKGTCAQIRAASALFKQKNRVDYIGLRLWRLGFPVDEKHWRPTLMRRARMLDRVIPFVIRLVQRFDRNCQEETFYDYAARRLEPINGVALSRIKGRIDPGGMPTVLRVIGDVGAGEFAGFEFSIAGEEHTSDKALTIREKNKHFCTNDRQPPGQRLGMGERTICGRPDPPGFGRRPLARRVGALGPAPCQKLASSLALMALSLALDARRPE